MLAPMAGFTDLPFRSICRDLGASYAPAEMVASQSSLRESAKSQERFNLSGEKPPRAIQLIGADPVEIAGAAKYAVSRGAQIIDFNCGCPARKVCSVECGSALLKEPEKIRNILRSLVDAVEVPVTLKYRLGWSRDNINAVEIARMAEDCGVQMLVLHGRTKDQGFSGAVDYETIAKVKQSVSVPLVANGDIDSSQKAQEVLNTTGANAVMVGRAAMGNPWIFQQIKDQLEGKPVREISYEQKIETILEHVNRHFDFYSEEKALRTIRKHISWYFKRLDLDPKFSIELFQSKDEKSFKRALKQILE